MSIMPDEPVLSAEETAKLLHIHTNTLRRWTAEGKIRRRPPSGRGEWYYLLKDVEGLFQKYLPTKLRQDYDKLETSRRGKPATERIADKIDNCTKDTSVLRESRCQQPGGNESHIIWMVDVDRPQYLTFVSPSICRLVGYSADEVMAMPMKGSS